MSGERDLQGEQDHAEFAGWAQAQGYDDGERYDFDELEFAFTSGMEAERDTADRLRALLDHETRLTWQSGLPGERARVAGVRERAGLEAL